MATTTPADVPAIVGASAGLCPMDSIMKGNLISGTYCAGGIKLTESSENAEAADMAAEQMAFTKSLDGFAAEHSPEISQPNNPTGSLNNEINLLRTYTPEPVPAPPSGGALGAELGTIARTTPAPDSNLAAVLDEMNAASHPAGSLAADSPDGSELAPTAPDFSTAGLNSLTKSLQEENTQLTTEVQTLTAQASQTTQMSNTMSQEASEVLANLEQEDEAAGKA